ncbi:MFS transporter [Microbacterium sp. Sa4CUA7]|uniref:MFS transporter n=1 Tax=Microbacterium pullorum TaxID=2762236 RepID=A0ABR8S343_9MICO|nr:MFS transporter [Microbacterium pullorum]
MPLALLIALADQYGFLLAAIIDGVYTILLAVAAPLRGRIVDTVGARRALVPMTVLSTLGLFAIVASIQFAAPWPLTLSLVVVSSLSAPPINAAIRVEWTRIVEGDPEKLKAVHSADSIIEEASFIAGPLLAGLALTVLGGIWAYTAAAMLTALVGALYLVHFFRRIDGSKVNDLEGYDFDVRGSRILGALASRKLLAILAPLIGMGFVFGGIDVYAPAYATALGEVGLAGIVLAMISVGGVIGGMLYATVNWSATLWTKYALLTLAFLAPVTFVAFADNLIVLCALLALGGLAVTPLYINAYLLVDRDVEHQYRHEANLWLGASTDLANGAMAIAIGGAVANQDWQTSRLVISASVVACGVLLITMFTVAYLRRRRQSA